MSTLYTFLSRSQEILAFVYFCSKQEKKDKCYHCHSRAMHNIHIKASTVPYFQKDESLWDKTTFPTPANINFSEKLGEKYTSCGYLQYDLSLPYYKNSRTLNCSTDPNFRPCFIKAAHCRTLVEGLCFNRPHWQTGLSTFLPKICKIVFLFAIDRMCQVISMMNNYVNFVSCTASPFLEEESISIRLGYLLGKNCL